MAKNVHAAGDKAPGPRALRPTFGPQIQAFICNAKKNVGKPAKNTMLPLKINATTAKTNRHQKAFIAL